MPGSISVRVSPTKSTAGQVNHNTREGYTPDYVDQDRSDQNTHFVATPDALNPAKLKDAQRTIVQHKIRSDTKTTWSGLVSFSKDAQRVIDALPVEKQDRLFNRVAQAVTEKLKAPLLSVHVHRDESAIHAHFEMLNATSDRKTIRMTPADARAIQDLAGQVCAELGLDIARGQPKVDRIAKGEGREKTVHRSVSELHRDLPKELEAKKAELASYTAKAGEWRQYASRLQQLSKTLQEREGDLQRREQDCSLIEQRADAMQARAERTDKRMAEIREALKVGKIVPADEHARVLDLLGRVTKEVPEASKWLAEQARALDAQKQKKTFRTSVDERPEQTRTRGMSM